MVPARARVAPFRVLAAVLGLLLLAFGLRVAGLETQSIWVDEGFSVDFSSRTAADMTAMWKARGGFGNIDDPATSAAANDPLAIAVDIHPPLYYLLLHEWMPLAGHGEYAVRFPSVIVGVLLMLVLFKLGTSLAGWGVGLAAAAVGAAAPFYVAYSQEARMYAPVALFSAFSLYFTWLVIRRRKVGFWPWLGLVLTSSLALYTHYSAVLVIASESILVTGVILFVRREGRLLAGWAAAQLVELALFFPWLRTTIGQVAKYNENLWVPNWQHELTATFGAFDAGLWIPDGESFRLAAAVTVVLIAGVAALVLKRRRTVALTFVACGLVVETGLALAAFQIRPEFHPRYLMVLATPYYLLLGLALVGLWRWWRPAGALAGIGLLTIAGVGLRGYEFDPYFAKDDTRTLAQYLTSHSTGSDVIIADAPEPLDYYYHGPATLGWAPGDEATIADVLNRQTAGKQRVMFVQWYLSTSDPEQLLPFLFQKYGQMVDDKTFRGYHLRTYAIPPNTKFELSPTSMPAEADFDNVLQLEGAGFSPAVGADPALLSRLEQPSAVSGRELMLALKWKLLAPASKDYKVSAYLTDSAGHLGGAVDLLLRHDQATTKRWQPGEESTNYYVLQTVPGLMPGKYTVNLAVYGDGEQERLSVLDAAGAPGGGNVAIGTVDVLPPESPPDRGSLNLAKGIDDAVAPGVILIGYDVPGQSIVQGDPLHLTLYWQASAQPPDGLKTTIALQSGSGASPFQWSAGPKFPTGEWRPGNIFRDWYDPVLPPQLAPGPYQLLVGMGRDMVPVGQVQVQERQRSFAPPSPQHPVSAGLGDSIDLLGYDTDKPSYAPGATAHITVYWRASAPMADSYTAFVHVLDSARHVVAQMDTIPQHGHLPTTAWLPNEVVADTYDLGLKPDLPAGSYQLEAGFYRGDTGARLKATSSGAKVIDDGILIGTLTVGK